MKPASAILGARGSVRVIGAVDAAGWTPPTSGRELLRAGLIGTGGGTPALALVVSDDVDPRRVIVFVLLGDLLCTFRPSGVERDALDVELPFRIGDQRALVVIVECESEAEAEELARIYAAERENLEAAAPEAEAPREAEPPVESAEPPSDVRTGSPRDAIGGRRRLVHRRPRLPGSAPRSPTCSARCPSRCGWTRPSSCDSGCRGGRSLPPPVPSTTPPWPTSTPRATSR